MTDRKQVLSLVTTKRTVLRGANPFAAVANAALTPPKDSPEVYESLNYRGNRAHKNTNVKAALQRLKARMGKQKYTQEDFGRLELVPLDLIDLNVINQRLEDAQHQANIIDRFVPGIALVVMCIKLKNGRYSAWEGQQTACIYYHLKEAGLVDPNILVQVKCIDEDHVTPGTALKGEAIGNYGFRQINGGGRKPIDAFHMHRSRVNGFRLYDSTFSEDEQSHKIQLTLEKNNMFPAMASEAKANQAKPGMVTYIHGLNTIACHGTANSVFDDGLKDLDWALEWHNRYYPKAKGVDGGFILAFGRLAQVIRTSKPKISAKAINTLGAELYELFRTNYGSPSAFHKECKARLGDFADANGIRYSWTDACLLPMLMLDYKAWEHSTVKLPKVAGEVTYENI